MLDELKSAARRVSGAHHLRGLMIDCKRLLSERGEANSVAIARDLVARFRSLPEDQQGTFFERLSRDFSPDPDAVLKSAQAYASEPSAGNLLRLTQLAEPPRQELLRRINRSPGGTSSIVAMRRALLARVGKQPELQAVEADFLHLLSSWFNPGFLQLQRVDWNSPAQLLEQIIRHEAVHEIDGWDDLRRRLQPDRRCFAFFHPQLPAEPLIFVEVALLPEMPAAIAPLIDKAAVPLPPSQYKVAAFYSISNCQPGLKGVSLGNFLIKRVAEELKRELPQLKTFCTLSPIPGFARWVRAGAICEGLPKGRSDRLGGALRGYWIGVYGGDFDHVELTLTDGGSLVHHLTDGLAGGDQLTVTLRASGPSIGPKFEVAMAGLDIRTPVGEAPLDLHFKRVKATFDMVTEEGSLADTVAFGAGGEVELAASFALDPFRFDLDVLAPWPRRPCSHRIAQDSGENCHGVPHRRHSLWLISLRRRRLARRSARAGRPVQRRLRGAARPGRARAAG